MQQQGHAEGHIEVEEALPSLVEHTMAAQVVERSIDLLERLSLTPSWWPQAVPLMGWADEEQAQSTVHVRSVKQELRVVDEGQAESIARAPVCSQ